MGISSESTEALYAEALRLIEQVTTDLTSLRAAVWSLRMASPHSACATSKAQPDGSLNCREPSRAKQEQSAEPLSSGIVHDRGEPINASSKRTPKFSPRNPEPVRIPKLLDATRAPAPLDVQMLWNRVADPALPRCRDMKGKRERMARMRLREHSLEDMERALRHMNGSTFHTGHNDRKWVASIDYFLRDTIITQFLEKADTAPRRLEYFKPGSPLARKPNP